MVNIIGIIIIIFIAIFIVAIVAAPFCIGLIVLRNKIKKCYENIGSKPFQVKKLYHILSVIIAISIIAFTVLILELLFGLSIQGSELILLAEFAGVYMIIETFFALYVYLKLQTYAENIK